MQAAAQVEVSSCLSLLLLLVEPWEVMGLVSLLGFRDFMSLNEFPSGKEVSAGEKSYITGAGDWPGQMQSLSMVSVCFFFFFLVLFLWHGACFMASVVTFSPPW